MYCMLNCMTSCYLKRSYEMTLIHLISFRGRVGTCQHNWTSIDTLLNCFNDRHAALLATDIVNMVAR
jgi:hypothetical protein